MARSPHGERAHWRGAQAAPRARSLRHRSSVARSRRCDAREGAKEKRNEARVCATEPERGFVRLKTSRSHRIEMDGSHSPDQDSAQAR
jgi:hypothetical protein